MKKKLLLMIILMFTCMTESIALSVGEVFLIDVDGVINVRFQVTSISPKRTVRIGTDGTVVLDPHGSPQGGPTYYSNDAYTYGTNNNPQTIISFEIPETVTGPDGNIYYVTSISEGAFTGKLLSSVTIPSTVETIGKDAFKGCSHLTSVSGGQGVKHIYESAFENCSSLWIFKLSNVLETIGDAAFYRCSGFGTGLELPSTLKTIGKNAFGRSGVRRIDLPSGIVKIEEATFLNCTNLNYVTIPETVTEIGAEAFENTALRTISMAGNIQKIGSLAFANVTTLTSVTVGNVNPPTLASDAFDSYSATLTVPKGCASAYQSATNWRNFTINESSIYGVNYVFTANVTGVDMTFKITKTQPYSVSVGNGSNAAVSSSVSGAVNIPMKFKLSGSTYTVTGISDKAFFLRSGLTEVTIPNSVTSIGANAFYECNQLTSVTVKNVEPFPISQYSFPQRTNATLYVPEGSEEAYENAQYWGDFGAIVAIPYSPEIDFADENVKTICVTNWDTDGDGELSEAEAAVVSDLGQAFRLNDKIASFDELQYFTGLTRIGEEAFYACHSLTSINLPEGVSSIDTGAFRSCDSLVSISLPKSITSINTQAFGGCKSLASISLPERLTSIGENAFAQCPFTSVTIPESVTTIGNEAFYLCHLTDVTMGSKVTSIGENAFLCSNLTFVRVGMESPISISRSSFYNYTNATLFVPVGSKEAYENAPYWSNFKIIKEMVSSPAITFSDTNVKAICVANWDTDDDGELSEDEAASVAELGEVFKANKQITSFDEMQYFTGLTSIAENAFYGCTGLTSVTIPNSVTSIGDDAFRGCSGLTSITIPNSVTSIGGRAFCFCSGLTSIEVEAGNSVYDSRGNCNAIIKTETNELISGCKNTVIPNSVTSIGRLAFFGYTGLTSVTIPNSVKIIGIQAFCDCTGLTSVTIPSSVTNIGMDAFMDCFGLASINVESGNTVYDSRNDCNAIIKTETNELILGCKNTIIPNNITSIAEDAFYGCTGLTSITIPNSVTNIGIDAFCFCYSLTSVTIGNSVTSIGETAFGECSALTSVTVGMETPPTINNVFTHRANATLYVPAGCKAAYEAAAHWQGFKDIVEVGTASPVIVFADANVKALCLAANWDTNGDGELSEAEAAAVTSLGEVFAENRQITSFNELQYFTGLTSINVGSFDRCSGLTSVMIPNSVTSIEGGAFRWCGLTSITIPNNVTSIESSVFFGCSGLTSVTIGNSVTSIGSLAFYGCEGLTSVTIPASVTSIGVCPFGHSGLTSIEVEAGNTVYDSRDNCNAIIKTETNELISGCKNTVIPDGVTSIAGGAFESCGGLTSITIPNSVTSIESAFVSCSDLISVTIGNSVTSIGANAFAWCNSLTSITIPNSVTSIGENAFYDCRLTSVTIPNSVTSIGSGAFNSNNLTSVTVGMETPIAIDNGTFFPCANATLNVPLGCKAAYEAAPYWQDFGRIVEPIAFADANVKAICVANWDTSGDGELSEAEAAAVTSLGEAFKENAEITSFNELQYFTGLTSIGGGAFRGCSGLTSITIPNSVTSIGDWSFTHCSALLSIIIPANVTNIGVGVFAGCYGMISMTVDDGNTAFDSRNGCNAIIQTSTNTLIAGCQNMTIPEGVTTIKDWAMNGIGTLTSVVFPNSLNSIGVGAFSYCGSLTSITIPANVTSIGVGAFSYCWSLTSITIPANVTSIGDEAFEGAALTAVKVDNTVPVAIGENTFTNRANATLYVPVGCKAAYEAAPYWQEFGSIVEMVDIVKNGDLEGTDVSCFFARDVLCDNNGSTPLYDPLPATIVEGEGMDGSRCIKIQSADNPAVAWDTQFFIRLPQTLPAGTKYHVSFDYKADHDASCSTEAHSEPGEYNWAGVGNVNYTTDWQHFDFDGTISAQQSPADNPMRTIAFCLAQEPTATTYYFDNIVFEIDESNYEPEVPRNTLFGLDTEGLVGAQDTLKIALTNTDVIRLCSFDLHLPAGVTVAFKENGKLNTIVSDRADTHSVSGIQLNNGDYRFVITSISGDDFIGHEGVLMSLVFNIAGDVEPGEYTVRVYNIELSLPVGNDLVAVNPSDTESKLTISNYIPGDVNNDGKTSVTDVGYAINYILEQIPSVFIFKAADMNHDGKITVTDVGYIINLILSDTAGSRKSHLQYNEREPQ